MFFFLCLAVSVSKAVSPAKIHKRSIALPKNIYKCIEKRKTETSCTTSTKRLSLNECSFFFSFVLLPRILYIPTVGEYFYSQEKRPHSLIVKCVSRGNLEIDSLLLTLCCHCVYSSCICVGLHRRTHFTGYLCDRPLQKIGRWKLLSESTSAVICPAEMQGCPESTQSHASFC